MVDDELHEPFVPTDAPDPGDSKIDIHQVKYWWDPDPEGDIRGPHGIDENVEYPTPKCTETLHLRFGGACFYCCPACNYDRHICSECGMSLKHNALEWRPRPDNPHKPHPDHRKYCPGLKT
jgi:hypothetical protein